MKVDGNTSSKPTKKATSSKPQAKTTKKIAAKPQIEVTENKPTPTEPTSPPPVSSEPTEPIEIPYNPDGPQHGDAKSFEDGTYYYHIGANGYIDEPMWQIWGKYFQAKDKVVEGGYEEFDGSFLNEGERQFVSFKKCNIVWCKVQNSWVKESAYNLNSHTGNDHGQNH